MKRRINIFFASILVLLIAFPTFSNFVFVSDIELEIIENFADGENESKEQKKLEKSEKDVILPMESSLKLLSNIKWLHNNQDFTKLYNLYLKIPTPPPDFT